MPANTAVAKKSKEVLPAHLKSTPMGNESAETIQSIPYLKLLADISPELNRLASIVNEAKEIVLKNLN